MNPIFRLRLFLDLFATLLLVFALSYWWLGNVPHEVAGTVLFVLLFAHNAFNRRWYGRSAKRHAPRSRIDLAATSLLLASMMALLVTSLLISNSLAGLFPFENSYTAQQVHVCAAYWATILVSVHLGMRWPVVMGVARRICGIDRDNRLRTLAVRVAAVAIAVQGAWSSSVVGLGDKLRMNMTLEWWDFEASLAGFFLHWFSVMGLFAVLGYYLTWLWLRRSALPCVGSETADPWTRHAPTAPKGSPGHSTCVRSLSKPQATEAARPVGDRTAGKRRSPCVDHVRHW